MQDALTETKNTAKIIPVSFMPTIGWMQYLNTLPMRVAFEEEAFIEHANSYEGTPSDLNQALKNAETDISLVSTASYLLNQEEWQLLPSLCIASYGRVDSVLWIHAEGFHPQKHHIIPVPKASASSTALLRYELNLQFPNHTFEFLAYSEDSCLQNHLEKYQNILLIGDSALDWTYENVYKQKSSWLVIDLATAWYSRQKLPFVFGVWCVRKHYFQHFEQEVHSWMHALQSGTLHQLNHPEKLLKHSKEHHILYEEGFLLPYWKESLHYTWNSEIAEALKQMEKDLSLSKIKPTIK